MYTTYDSYITLSTGTILFIEHVVMLEPLSINVLKTTEKPEHTLRRLSKMYSADALESLGFNVSDVTYELLEYDKLSVGVQHYYYDDDDKELGGEWCRIPKKTERHVCCYRPNEDNKYTLDFDEYAFFPKSLYELPLMYRAYLTDTVADVYVTVTEARKIMELKNPVGGGVVLA